MAELKVTQAKGYVLVQEPPNEKVTQAAAYVLVEGPAFYKLTTAKVYVLLEPAPLAVTSVTPNHGPDVGGTRVRVVHNGGI